MTSAPLHNVVYVYVIYNINRRQEASWSTTWRITPVSKLLLTPIWKPFRPFERGTTLLRGPFYYGFKPLTNWDDPPRTWRNHPSHWLRDPSHVLPSHPWCILTPQLDRVSWDVWSSQTRSIPMQRVCQSQSVVVVLDSICHQTSWDLFRHSVDSTEGGEGQARFPVENFGCRSVVVVACISPSIKTSKTVTDVFGRLETGVASGRNSQFSETLLFVHFVDKDDEYFSLVKH